MADDEGMLYRIDGCAAAIQVCDAGGFTGRFLEGRARGREATSGSMRLVIAELQEILRSSNVRLTSAEEVT